MYKMRTKIWLRLRSMNWFKLGTLQNLAVYGVMVLGGIVMIVPFFIMITSSLKTAEEILRFPPTIFPETFNINNYIEVWQKGDFSLYFINSTLIAVSRTLLLVATSTLGGYVFARLEFPGRKSIFLLLLATLMLPSQVTLIPVYVLVKRMPLIGGNDIFGWGGSGLINTYAGLIIPGYVYPFGIFLMRQFMGTLPRELDDAARIDGCGEFRIFYNIILPLTTPALATLSLLSFQGVWNDFLWPLLIGQKRELWTLQVGLAHIRSGLESGAVQWPEIMAATVLATMPVIIIFLFTQKYFIKGIALSGLD